jgi:adenosylcobinamide-phosphate synthase|tara:strand:- start:4002 stop:4772 length:771 start_codon:yes stop_codon:yes gene_type:complete
MILLLITGFWCAAAYFAAAGLRDVHQVAYVLVGGFLLKTTFSVKMLHQTAARVRELLTAGDMAGVRAQMSSLVSRDPSQLTAEGATAATVESVSENIADSIIGPWLAFALFGLPGAVAYRAINTLDSMIGYHGRYEYLGKASARFDDLVNLIPSRLAGLLLVIASLVLPGQKASDAWRIMLRDHGKTESPNAGWTMSGMAGALGVELEKADHYRLGDARRQVEPEDITRTVRTMYVVAGAGLLLALGITYLRSGIW